MQLEMAKSLGHYIGLLPFCWICSDLDICAFTENKPTRKPENQNDGATRLLFHTIESDAYNNNKFTNSTELTRK